jgi:hypothetical protein
MSLALLPSLPGVAGWALAPLAAGYPLLIAVVACAAVFSRKPARRHAAYDVLLLLLPGAAALPHAPGRRRPIGATTPTAPMMCRAGCAGVPGYSVVLPASFALRWPAVNNQGDAVEDADCWAVSSLIKSTSTMPGWRSCPR